MNSSYGRWALMLIVLAGFVASIITLTVISQGGAIHGDKVSETQDQLLSIYLPMLVTIGTFYFAMGKKASEKHRVSPEATAFAVLVALVWCACPPLMLAINQYVEDALSTLRSLGPFGESTAVAAVSFYFFRSSSDDGRNETPKK